MFDPPATQHVAAACDICDNSGYKGRIGIYEMLNFDEPIRTAVRAGGRNDEIRSLARASGMKLMQEYSLDLVKRGLTTLEEVLRVIPFEAVQSRPCPRCGRDLMPSFLLCPYCGEKRKERGAASLPSAVAKGQPVKEKEEEGVLER